MCEEYILGLNLENSRGAERDMKRVIELYEIAEEKGFFTATRNLRRCYREGDGVTMDEERATELDAAYAASMENNNRKQKHMQTLITLGTNWCQRNASRNLYDLARNQNYEYRHLAAGLYYLNDVKKNDIYAVELLQMAAAQSNCVAQAVLGSCYLRSLGVAKDEERAVELFRASANQGFMGGLMDLAKCYQFGTGVQKNETYASQLLEAAADRGNSAAQCMIGTRFLFGVGIQRNLVAAEHFLQASADQGCARGFAYLGVCFQENKKEKEAVQFFQIAADQNDNEGQYQLGRCYQLGLGVEKNKERALQMYNLAANQNHLNARICIAHCY